MRPLNGLFVTGTDTGVGKTFVAAAIVRLLTSQNVRVGAYKPAASGAEITPQGPSWDDVETLHTALDGRFPRERICPQTFLAPLAPPVAARSEGRAVDPQRLRTGVDWWRERVDGLIVEGAGGLLSPISESDLVADVARDLGFPLLIVARLGLGTINHTLLTVEAALDRKLPVAGIILNEAAPRDPHDLSAESNPQELARLSSVPILAVVEHQPPTRLLQPPASLRIDWWKLQSG